MESSTAAVCELPAKLELGAQLYRKKKLFSKIINIFQNLLIMPLHSAGRRKQFPESGNVGTR